MRQCIGYEAQQTKRLEELRAEMELMITGNASPGTNPNLDEKNDDPDQSCRFCEAQVAAQVEALFSEREKVQHKRDVKLSGAHTTADFIDHCAECGLRWFEDPRKQAAAQSKQFIYGQIRCMNRDGTNEDCLIGRKECYWVQKETTISHIYNHLQQEHGGEYTLSGLCQAMSDPATPGKFTFRAGDTHEYIRDGQGGPWRGMYALRLHLREYGGCKGSCTAARCDDSGLPDSRRRHQARNSPCQSWSECKLTVTGSFTGGVLEPRIKIRLSDKTVQVLDEEAAAAAWRAAREREESEGNLVGTGVATPERRRRRRLLERLQGLN